MQLKISPQVQVQRAIIGTKIKCEIRIIQSDIVDCSPKI